MSQGYDTAVHIIYIAGIIGVCANLEWTRTVAASLIGGTGEAVLAADGFLVLAMCIGLYIVAVYVSTDCIGISRVMTEIAGRLIRALAGIFIAAVIVSNIGGVMMRIPRLDAYARAGTDWVAAWFHDHVPTPAPTHQSWGSWIFSMALD